jgi:hypothetical protein
VLHATIHGVSQPEVEQRASGAPGAPPAASRRDIALAERLTRHLLPYGVALVVLQLAFRGWALSGSWFYFDDIAFMSRAMNQPLDSSYLLESYGGHLMPGGFLVVWLLTKVAVYSWAPWAAVLLVLQAAAGLGMLRLLVSLFGRRPLVLALLAGYLSYVFTLSAGIWFAAGINQLPMQVALVFGLHSHVAYLRHRRLGSLVAALAWTVAGLVFYEKTLLLLGIYAILGLGWFATGGTTDRLRHVWTHYRAGVLAYGALGIGYLGFYVHYGLDFSPGSANAQPWSPIAYNLVGYTMLPGLVGGPLRWQPLGVGAFGSPSQAVVLVSWAAFVAVVVHAQRTRTRALRAWAPLAFTVACNVVLLASARANVVGPEIAREYRYQTETSALFVIGLGLALLPLLGAPEVNELREPEDSVTAEEAEPPEPPEPPEPLVPAVPAEPDNPRVVAAIAVAVVLAALLSSTRYVHLWQDDNPSKAYFAQVRRTLAAAADKPVPLVDTGIPQSLLWAYRYPEDAYSHVFRDLDDETSYPRSSMDRLYMFDDGGRLSPVAISETRVQLPGSGCGYPLDADTTSIPLDGPVIGGGWWIRVAYASPRAVHLHLQAGDEGHDLSLPSGLHNVFVQAAGTFDDVVLSDYPEDTGLCVTALTLGLPSPTPPAS